MSDDPYRWLESESDPATARWTAAQEQTYQQHAESWRMRDRLRARLSDLCAPPGPVGTPRRRGGRLFADWMAAGAEQPVVLAFGPDVRQRVLIDPSALDPSGGTTLLAWEPSWDGGLVAYETASGGTEHGVLFVLDTETLELVDGPIDRVRYGSLAWLPDNSGFYYVRLREPEDPAQAQYHRRVYLHRLGTPADQDALVFGEGRSMTQLYSVDIAPDGRWLVVTAAEGTAAHRDVWIANLSAGDPAVPRFEVVHEGLPARSSFRLRAGTGPDDACYVLTDLGAGHGRIVRTTPGCPSPETWVDVVAQDSGAVLQDFAVLDGSAPDRPVLVASWSRHAVAELTVHDPADGRRIGEVALPPASAIGTLRTGPAGGSEVWFTLSGFTTPTEARCYDVTTRTLTTWTPGEGAPVGQDGPPARTAALATEPRAETRATSLVAPAHDIDITQTTFLSRDGTPVRMFVVCRQGRTGPRPTLLTGYGGFGRSLVPAYSAEIAAWVEAGGVYAVAGLRGGGEEGEEWHRAGMLGNKHNSFDDFDAAADHLLSQGWTTRPQLGLVGRSNGGLLVSVAVTRRPGCCAAFAALAPLTDMIRYEEFGLGALWTGEYGSASDPEQARWLMGYSPYHHVLAGERYPAALIAAFEGDSRVDPLHARKLCAALQAATTSGMPVLYRYERGVGHGVRPASRQVGLIGDVLAFFAEHLGLDGSD